MNDNIVYRIPNRFWLSFIGVMIRVMVFSATFNNVSVKSWRSVLLVPTHFLYQPRKVNRHACVCHNAIVIDVAFLFYNLAIGCV
jgi:hypothetical protein